MKTQSQCVICGKPDAKAYRQGAEEHECGYCGRYVCQEWAGVNKFADTVEARRHLLAGIVRNMNELNRGGPFTLPERFWESWENVSKVSPLTIPGETDVVAKAGFVLRHLQRKSQCLGRGVDLTTCVDFPLGFCQTDFEFEFIVEFMKGQGWINESQQANQPPTATTKWYVITPIGWAYLNSAGTDAKDQGFIAMAFRQPFANDLWRKGLEIGIGNGGYAPMRIDNKEHNNRIDDEIVAEIRKSRFVVADLTGKNAGAYFEAGFAMGLGKPVIWTCQQAEIDANNIHFDTRQYSIVSWTENDWPDFAKRLTQRIEATIGHGKYIPTKP